MQWNASDHHGTHVHVIVCYDIIYILCTQSVHLSILYLHVPLTDVNMYDIYLGKLEYIYCVI